MTEADDEGKVVWPIPEEGISYLTPSETLLRYLGGGLNVSKFVENGDDYSGNLALSLFGPYNTYFHKPSQAGPRRELDEPADFSILDEMESADWSKNDERAAAREKSERLIVRLLRAYHDWETNEATWTLDELRARPLPAATT